MHDAMHDTNDPRYAAVRSHDPRFDGVFFVGVTSTRIYCRPICPSRTPKPAHCRFYTSAEAAEHAGFRPCLRCRPELAPGNAPVDDAQRIAQMLLARFDEDLLTGHTTLEDCAAQFELSSRQLRRIVRQEYGVSPVQLLQTRRLLLAKQLLTETSLPMVQVAFASGFKSVRRFNEVFSTHYRMPPSRLRARLAATANGTDPEAHGATSTVQLAYRPPYDWAGVLAFLRMRRLQGAETCTDDTYRRTVRLGDHTGWLCVSQAPQQNALRIEFSHTLAPVLPALLRRLRHVFDLDARPDVIAAQLQQDPLLRPAVRQNPGLRVPGAFDGFELAVRAILGQQITVKAATTLGSRLTAAFGERIATPFADLTHLPPTAKRLAKASRDSVAKWGIVGARAESIIALAKACTQGSVHIAVGADPERVFKQLLALPGVGPWTAHYIAMRALRWPDAFPKEDIAVRKKLGGVSARQAEALSQAWRPWRSYAVLHLWSGATTPP